MSEEIQFLESLGGSPALAQPCPVDYADAVTVLGMDNRKQAALLDRDVQVLSKLLGGRASMAMAIATPDNGDESQEAPERQDDEQESEDFPMERDRPD